MLALSNIEIEHAQWVEKVAASQRRVSRLTQKNFSVIFLQQTSLTRVT